MPTATFVKSSTPVSTVSSTAPNNTTAITSGPYTKAQCKGFIIFLFRIFNLVVFFRSSKYNGRFTNNKKF
jgi:hypothetical protein